MAWIRRPFSISIFRRCRGLRMILAGALRLPTMEIDGQRLLKRLTLVIDSGYITKIIYPVFPPDRHAEEVLAWLEANRP
jgi:peroxiredoxin